MPIPDEVLDALGIAAGCVDVLTETNLATSMKEGITAMNDVQAINDRYPPNPHLVENGHAQPGAKRASPACAKYFTWRMVKKVGGGLVSTGGNIAGVVTQVNVGGIARHGRAEIKTLAHLSHYLAMAKKVRQSEYLSSLLSTVIIMKWTKAATQGGKLTASCIPNPIAAAAVSAAAGIGGGIMKRSRASAVAHAAVELHWRAFQESAVAGALGGDGSGPAMRIVRQLFRQAAACGPNWAKPDRYIAEPAGWMVIQDKLNLV